MRSLSGLKTAEFDTLDVTDKITAQDLETQGTFAHTGATPAEFDTMTVGTLGNVNSVLTINGSVLCTGDITTTGLHHVLKFAASDGSLLATYDGGAETTFTAPSPPAAATPSVLSFGYLDGGTHSPASYDTTAARAIKIPRTLTTSLTATTQQSVNISDAPALVKSGFGLTFGSLPTDTKVKVDVQMFIANPTSSTEEFFVALTSSTTAVSPHHAREVVWQASPDEIGLVQYSKVLTLSGAASIGLAVDTKDQEYGCYVYYGGDFPDVILSATVVDYVAPPDDY